jgi:uncharacterized membrane-anchored protein
LKSYCGAAIAVLALFVAQSARGADQGSDAAEAQRLNGIVQSQHRRSGDVAVPGAEATLHLGSKYYFLDAADSKQVLKEWGNPPSAADGVLGMVFPAGKSFLDDTWAGVITYEQSGYVSDEDADKVDYQKYVDEAHKGEDAENEQRKKDGFSSVHLVGWAQPPTYDRAHHYLIWAQDIKFGGAEEDTLNYDIRVLGRRGVLSVNAVSTMGKLPEIRPQAEDLAGAAQFNPGSAYADYQPNVDHKAEYGVAGLVAAGLGLAAAKKFGLLALFAVFGKKIAVFVAVAFAALAARVKSIFKRKST